MDVLATFYANEFVNAARRAPEQVSDMFDFNAVCAVTAMAVTSPRLSRLRSDSFSTSFSTDVSDPPPVGTDATSDLEGSDAQMMHI